MIEHLLFIISKLTALKEQCYLLIEIIIILIIVGLGAGTLGSMIGVGGGIIMTPVLSFYRAYAIPYSSTSLIAVTSASVSSTIAYSKQKRIDYGVGLKMGLYLFPALSLGHSFQAEYQ